MRRLGLFLFWFLALGVAVVSLRFLILPLAMVMPNMAHYQPVAPLALYAHILFGPLAMALAPFQLWGGLRRARPRLHRVLGYVCALSILLAGLGTLAFLPWFLGSLWAATGFALLALAWIAVTARAVWLARARRLAEHRDWMLRSVALTFAGVTLRLIMPVLIAQGWSVPETFDVTGWACWIPNLIVMEIWLRRKRRRAPEGALTV